ncbi:4-(cytidine 5'-diphospho)-2-C-methyl-D-erythritol kinase [Rickettsiales bacterium]|nr:4-(cytidine 5'-diphospho)-2-C-methyl-D-erythritol kinase [Rickettsiales bacterium]
MSRFLSPAKINLFLHILGKRSDGYHILQSLMALTDICDFIDISKSDNLSLKISGEFSCGIDVEDNLVINAARLLKQESGTANLGAEISLHKNIPIGAGLGGGSSNAATTLMALNKTWNLGLSIDELAKIAIKLGADVPFFLYKKAAWVNGVGEFVKPADNLPNMPLVLVFPNIFSSTPDVFKKGFGSYSNSIEEFFPESFDDFVNWLKNLENDLTDNAISLNSQIKEVLDCLNGFEDIRMARMSGSGSCCFGIFDSYENAQEAAKEIRGKHKNWWVAASYLK